jgi:hypothetical protein
MCVRGRDFGRDTWARRQAIGWMSCSGSTPSAWTGGPNATASGARRCFVTDPAVFDPGAIHWRADRPSVGLSRYRHSRICWLALPVAILPSGPQVTVWTSLWGAKVRTWLPLAMSKILMVRYS